MELSDILSAFFVSKPVNKKQDKRQVTNVCTQTETKLSSVEDVESEKKIEENVEESTVKDVEESTESSVDEKTETTESTETPREVSESFSDKGVLAKKFILRGVDLRKKNIFITNKDIDDNVVVLSEVIDSLSLIKGIDDLYTKRVYVITSSENRQAFKKMMLDNPYMYFTDFIVKSSIPSKKIEEICEDKRKTIIVVDANVDTDVSKLFRESIQLFVVGSNNNVVETYKASEESKLVLFKKEKTKPLQKIFFNTFVRNVCNVDIGFQEFYDYFNKKIFGVKYIIIKDGELRYY
jgi:hypothetical protein